MIRRKYTTGRLGKGQYLVHGNHGDKFIVHRYENDHDCSEWTNPPANPPKLLWAVWDARWDDFGQPEWMGRSRGWVNGEWTTTDLVDDYILTMRDAVQCAINVDFARHNPEHGPTRADYLEILGPIHGPTRRQFRRPADGARGWRHQRVAS